MGFWEDLFGGGMQAAGTPGYNPGASTPGRSAPVDLIGQPGSNNRTSSGSSRLDYWLPLILGAGTSLAGSYMQNRSINQNNELLRARAALMDKLAQEELARREHYAQQVLPSLQSALRGERGSVYSMGDPSKQRMVRAAPQAAPMAQQQAVQALTGVDAQGRSYQIRKPGEDYGEVLYDGGNSGPTARGY